MDFSDQAKSLVIGGASGIGRALSDALRRHRGRVIRASRSTGLDVTDLDSVRTFFEAHGLHVVFAAGSQAPSGRLADLDLKVVKSAFDVKFWGSVAVAQATAKNIRPNGTLTLTSGFLARFSILSTFAKTAANAMLEATTRIVARKLAPVRVNIISPGLTMTEAYSGMEETARDKIYQQGV